MRTTRIAGFSAGYIIKVTIAAVIGILLLKWITAKVNVPGLSRAVQAV